MKEIVFFINYMVVILYKVCLYGNWNGWKEYFVIIEFYGDGVLFIILCD